ncbi:MAG: hypothetical protein IKV41_03015 [Oscillospiraceae bacterium]|nr:hypothetical protein [Oscillospiraceae bacterium]
MDDIAAQIGQILNDPQAMSQIQSIAASLGLNPNSSPPAPPPQQQNSGIDTSMLMNMLGSLLSGNSGNSSQAVATPPPIDPNMILSIQQAMSTFQSTNQNVQLLRALRPHFGPERQKKVDDAIKIMQLINVLPLIKQSGLFGSGGDF